MPPPGVTPRTVQPKRGNANLSHQTCFDWTLGLVNYGNEHAGRNAIERRGGLIAPVIVWQFALLRTKRRQRCTNRAAIGHVDHMAEYTPSPAQLKMLAREIGIPIPPVFPGGNGGIRDPPFPIWPGIQKRGIPIPDSAGYGNRGPGGGGPGDFVVWPSGAAAHAQDCQCGT